MAVTVKVSSIYGDYYYIDSSSASDVLTREQMESNVTAIFNAASDLYPSWSLEAISALCGNSQSEGVLNPNQWEYGYGKDPEHGYGLWQWTPATKFLDWCRNNGWPVNDIEHQVQRLEFERSTGIQYYQTPGYPFGFTSFLEGEHTVEELAKAWLYNYERPADPSASESARVKQSEDWYEFLSGKKPFRKSKQKLPFYMYPAWRNRI